MSFSILLPAVILVVSGSCSTKYAQAPSWRSFHRLNNTKRALFFSYGSACASRRMVRLETSWNRESEWWDPGTGAAPAENGWAQGWWPALQLPSTCFSPCVQSVRNLLSAGDCSSDYLCAADMFGLRCILWYCQALFGMLIIAGSSTRKASFSCSFSCVAGSFGIADLTCFGCIWICLNPVSPMMQDEPAEDACQNTDAWKECGEASGLGLVTSWCQWMFFCKAVSEDWFDTVW